MSFITRFITPAFKTSLITTNIRTTSTRFLSTAQTHLEKQPELTTSDIEDLTSSTPNADSSSKTSNTKTQPVDMSGKNPGNVIGGHKATISDPNRSEEAKAHSQQVLDEQFDGGEGVGGGIGRGQSSEKNENNVIGGYKATLSNPTTGSGAKAKAKKKLNEMGVEVEDE